MYSSVLLNNLIKSIKAVLVYTTLYCTFESVARLPVVTPGSAVGALVLPTVEVASKICLCFGVG